MGIRNGHDRAGGLRHLLPAALRGQGQHVGPPGFHLHHIAHSLFKQPAIGAQRHHQGAVLNQADGAVLQLAGGIGLGVDIGDLLQLQGALQPQGVVQVPANVEHRVVVEVLGGEILDMFPIRQHLLHLAGQQLHLLQGRPAVRRVRRPPHLGKEESQQIHHRHLGGIGLGGGHRDLRPGPGVQHFIRLPGDGTAHHVDNGQDPPPQPPGLPQGGQGVQCLSRLADDHHQGALIHDGIHIPELRGQGHLHRDAGQPLQIVFPHHSHMVAGAAGHNVNFPDVPDVRLRQA